MPMYTEPPLSKNASLEEIATDAAAEAAAKAKWDAFQPAEETIEWYDRFYAEIQDIRDRPGQPGSHYYRILLSQLAEYRQEREKFGDDEAWLVCLRDQYMEEEAGLATDAR